MLCKRWSYPHFVSQTCWNILGKGQVLRVRHTMCDDGRFKGHNCSINEIVRTATRECCINRVVKSIADIIPGRPDERASATSGRIFMHDGIWDRIFVVPVVNLRNAWNDVIGATTPCWCGGGGYGLYYGSAVVVLDIIVLAANCGRRGGRWSAMSWSHHHDRHSTVKHAV